MATPETPARASLTVDEARALFPGLEGMTYFATNGQALLPAPTRDVLIQGAERLASRGYAGALRLEREIDDVRARVASVIGADTDEVAFVRNTGEGLCLAADLIDWRTDDEVLSFEGEYRSVVHAFQGVAHRGVQVRVVPPEAHAGVTADLVERALGPRTRAVALSWVRYDNGARADLEAIGALLAQRNVLFIVDGIQGVGALPLDVHGTRIDVLAAGAHKWMLGVSGTGVLYLRRGLRPDLIATHLGVTSMRDAETTHTTGDPYVVCPVDAARRVEEGSRNSLGIAALGSSLELYERVGRETVAERIHAVTEQLCEGFRAAGGRVRSPRGEGEWSGIVLLEPPPGVDANELSAKLVRERIMIGAREGALWGSAHYFNSPDDAERLLSFL